MSENKNENLHHLLEEFQINKGLDTNKHIELLRQLESRPKNEVISTLNLFLEEETNSDVLLYLAKTAAKYNDFSSLGVLTELLLWKDEFKSKFKNPDEYLKVRCLAATVIGNIKDNKSVLPLLYILNSKDENYKLRLSCAEALGKIGNKHAVAPLIDVLSDEEERSVYVRESAAKALGLLGDTSAVEPLVTILETKKGIIDKFTFLKERIIESLAKIGFKDNRTISVLTNSLYDNSSFVRLRAIEALSEINDERVLPLVEKMLDDEEEDVARSAVNALYNLQGPKYLEYLLKKENLAGWCRDEIETILEESESNTENE